MKFLPPLAILVAFAIVPPTATRAADTPVQVAPAASELHIGVIMFDRTSAIDYVGPVTYFEFLPLVNKTAKFTTVSNRAGHIQPSFLPGIYANVAYKDAPSQFDVLVIPGGPGDAGVIADAAFVNYIQRAGEQSTFVLSICTGGDILASTGLLDGRNATTNKRKFKKISSAHPRVNWVRKARWVVDGKFWTSSGGTAGMDMGHAFFEFLFGKAKADQAAGLIETVPITDPSNDPFEYVIDLN